MILRSEATTIITHRQALPAAPLPYTPAGLYISTYPPTIHGRDPSAHHTQTQNKEAKTPPR